MTIKQQGGIFGRNPTFNNLDVDGLTNFNNTVRIARSSGTLLELYDADGGQEASKFSVTNGGRDMTIFAPQDIIFTQDGLETARFLDGGGLTFNGDTAAANALDDYEEGTWTVELYDAASGGNVSPTTATGYYTKMGRQVSITFSLSNIDTTGMTSGNQLYFTLPFTAGFVSAGSLVLESFALASGRTWVSSWVNAADARGRFRQSGDAVTAASLTVGTITSGTSDIERCTLTYFVG